MFKLLLHLATLAMFCAPVFAQEPFAGTWKLNLAKSKYVAAMAAPPKELTLFGREIGGGQIEFTVTVTTADGAPMVQKFAVAQQGGVEQFQQGAPPAGTMVVAMKTDPWTVDNIVLRDNKQVQVTHQVVSRDGKTWRGTVRGIDAQGKAYEGLLVFDKQ